MPPSLAKRPHRCSLHRLMSKRTAAGAMPLPQNSRFSQKPTAASILAAPSEGFRSRRPACTAMRLKACSACFRTHSGDLSGQLISATIQEIILHSCMSLQAVVHHQLLQLEATTANACKGLVSRLVIWQALEDTTSAAPWQCAGLRALSGAKHSMA